MMNYNFIPSLEHTALVKIASTMWDEDDISEIVEDFVHPKMPPMKFCVDDRIKDKIVEKMPRYSLPNLLERKLEDLVDPIGLEIIKWRQCHENYFPTKFVDESLDKLCWTQRGAVDKKKTAETLVKNENIFISIRYKLACIYCLEHDIPILWSKMPQHLRNTYYIQTRSSNTESKSFEVIWAYALNGRLDDLANNMEEFFGVRIGPYQYGFKQAVFSANEVAAKYFFLKLTPDERNNSLVRFITYVVPSNVRSLYNGMPSTCFSNILCFLLSQMNEEQQKEVFTKYSLDIMTHFLGWPLQTLFMRMANLGWDFLSMEDFYRLLFLIAEKTAFGSNDFNYHKIFTEFWHQSPNSYKQYIVSNPKLTDQLLLHLFLAGDENNILLIFKEASLQEKEAIIFFHDGMLVCNMLVTCKRWDLLKLFIDECVSSRSMKTKFMEKFKRYIVIKFHSRPAQAAKKKKILWSKICRNLHKEDTKKRKVNEGDKRRSKRLCNKSLAN